MNCCLLWIVVGVCYLQTYIPVCIHNQLSIHLFVNFGRVGKVGAIPKNCQFINRMLFARSKLIHLFSGSNLHEPGKQYWCPIHYWCSETEIAEKKSLWVVLMADTVIWVSSLTVHVTILYTSEWAGSQCDFSFDLFLVLVLVLPTTK